MSAATDLSNKLKATVLSTRFDDVPAPPLGTDVGFSIVVSPKLKLAGSLMKSLIHTIDGELHQKSPSDPIFIAAPSISVVPIMDVRQYALQRLHQDANTTINSVTSVSEVTIDGYEIIAEATDTKSDTSLCVYQVFLYDTDGSYFLMMGLVGANGAKEYLPEFKAMAHSLTQDP